MAGWVKFLGELAWRVCRLPEGIEGVERQENFYFRLYGSVSLFLSLVLAISTLPWTLGPFSTLVSAITTAAGAGSSAIVNWVPVGAAIAFLAPLVFGATLGFALVITFAVALVVRILRIWAVLSVKWANRRVKIKSSLPPRPPVAYEPSTTPVSVPPPMPAPAQEVAAAQPPEFLASERPKAPPSSPMVLRPEEKGLLAFVLFFIALAILWVAGQHPNQQTRSPGPDSQPPTKNDPPPQAPPHDDTQPAA